MADNAPKIDLNAALDPGALAAWLEYEFHDHTVQANAFQAMFARFEAATANGIENDDVLARAGDAVKAVKDELASLDRTHERIKKPVLSAQRAIDGGRKKLADPLKEIADAVMAKQNAYLTARSERVRKAAAEEAARLELEAQEAAKLADRTGDREDLAVAMEIFEKAGNAAETATASTIDLARTRTPGGSLVGQKDNWQYRVVDIYLVPHAYLVVDSAMVRASMKTAGKNIKLLKIPGIEFFNEPKAYVK